MKRGVRFVAACVALAVLAWPVVGCAKKAEKPVAETVEDRGVPIRIGVLPTEDSLPLWVAETRGAYAAAGIPGVQIVDFQSAQERDAAFASGAIDAYMGDLIAAANLQASGAENRVLTVMLGSEPSQGRFGIVASPKDGAKNLKEAAKQGVGTSSATIQEYVLDGLMAEAGIKADDIKKVEIKKVPVRYELLMQGKVKSAALPEPFLSLAIAEGAKLLAEDTNSKQNLSQTVLGVSEKFLATERGRETARLLLAEWNEDVGRINSKPEEWRALLVQKAKIPQPLMQSYQINQYPSRKLPQKAEVDAVLTWMKEHRYLKSDVTYEDLTKPLPDAQ